MKFHHAGLVVPNLETAIRFYNQVFSFTPVFRGGWQAPSAVFDAITGLNGSAAQTAFMQGPCGFLELFEYQAPQPSSDPGNQRASDFGIRHLAIETDNPAQLARVLTAAGGSLEGRHVAVPGGAEAVYCRDPFGNLIELLKPGGKIPAA